MTGFETFLPIIRLCLHVSSSCHIVRDEWWTAAAAAGHSTPILKTNRRLVPYAIEKDA